MTQNKLLTLNAADRAAWLDGASPTGSWSQGDDIYCLHCDGVFKAEDVACDREGDPTCPLCQSATPLDFHGLPWWRDDLVDEDDDGAHSWKGAPITATPGKPARLPEP